MSVVPKVKEHAVPRGTGPQERIRRFRWWICILLFIVTVTNYVDRQTISIVAPVISAKYRFTDSEIAIIVNAFLLAYTFGQLFSGAVIDRIGSRKGLTIAASLWSCASIVTGLARTVFSFSMFRFLLGVAESANFSTGVKVIAEWFPIQERSTAVGIFVSGASVGAIATPPLVAYLVVHFGWQLAFVVVGIPGLIWVVFWLLLYAPAAEHPRLTEQERTYILSGQDGLTSAPHSPLPLGALLSFLLKQRLFWGVFLGRFIEEPASWFYLTWLPLYLKGFRGVSLMNIGLLLTIPFIALDLGYVTGGWASSQLIKFGRSLDRARKCVMLVSSLCMVASIPAVLAPSTLGFVGLVSVATFGHGSWAANIMTLPGDMVPQRFVGTLYGITAFGGGLGSMLFMQLTGRLVDLEHSFTTAFIIAGILPVLAAVVVLSISGKIELLRVPEGRSGLLDGSPVTSRGTL